MPVIGSIETAIVAVPMERPVRTVLRSDDHLIAVLARLQVGRFYGVGLVSCFTVPIASAICNLIEHASAQLVGRSFSLATPEETSRQALRLIGPGGPASTAIAALDLAAWDIAGQLAEQPVHRLLGSQRSELAAYASDGCWLDPPDQVVRDAVTAIEAGFRTVKVRAGRARLSDDIDVVRAVRGTVGPEVELIVDVNQGWTRATTVEALPQLEALEVAWLEEPLQADDLQGYALLSSNSVVRLVVGESQFAGTELVDLVRAAEVGLLTPDLQRLGGVSGWRRAVEPVRLDVGRVSSHLYPEFNVHLLAAEGVPGPLEWVGWHRPLLLHGPTPADGRIAVPEEPGFGLVYDWDAVERFSVAVTASRG